MMAWEAIDILEARETLVAMKVESFPHMKNADREKMHRSLHRMAYPTTYAKPVALTIEKMAAMING